MRTDNTACHWDADRFIDVTSSDASVRARPCAPNGLVQRLGEELHNRGVMHCHWKGTFSLRQGMDGTKDVDLLVRAADTVALKGVLSGLGFKEAAGPAWNRLTGTTEYFGFDQDSHRIIQVHVHERCVIGHPLRGVHHLPMERVFLESSRKQFPFSTPQPELEFVVYVLRMFLDARSWRTTSSHQHAACLSERRMREFEFLRAQVLRSSIDVVLKDHFPFLDPAFLWKCSEALAEPIQPRLRVTLSRQVRRVLARHCPARQSPSRALALWHRVTRAVRTRVLRIPASKQRLLEGGTMIALVGGDGAGKTTAIGHLRMWLAKHFDMRTVHLGKPPRSWITRVTRGSLKLVRSLRACLPLRSRSTSEAASGPRLSQLCWYFCAAHDRYRCYKLNRRRVAAGEIVVFDRWPILDLLSMDGPQIRRVVSPDRMNWALNWMANCEERWHREIGQPDCLIVLRLDPKTAVQRKPEEDAQFVESRGMEVWNAPWGETRALVVDASAPVESVLSQVKAHVWRAI